MKTSESIKEIATAICKMQASLKPADKDNTNPMYKSRYSDINSVWETLRTPLTSNGLSVWQDATTSETGVSISTKVVHASGEWIEFGPFTVPLGAKKDAHGFGSCCTYAKKYSLCAALGITSSDDDDDGNAACGKPTPPTQPAAQPAVSSNITDVEALQKLSKYPDSVNILMFLKDRATKFKSNLLVQVEGFIEQEEMALAEFYMWQTNQGLKKK